MRRLNIKGWPHLSGFVLTGGGRTSCLWGTASFKLHASSWRTKYVGLYVLFYGLYFYKNLTNPHTAGVFMQDSNTKRGRSCSKYTGPAVLLLYWVHINGELLNVLIECHILSKKSSLYEADVLWSFLCDKSHFLKTIISLLKEFIILIDSYLMLVI